MDISQFKKIKKIIDRFLTELEDNALAEGEDISSPEFQGILLKVKTKLVEKWGLSLEEYEQIEKSLGKNKRAAESVDYLMKRLKSFNEEDLKSIRDEMNQIVENLKSEISQNIQNINWNNLQGKPKLFSEQDAKKVVEKYGLKEKDISQLAIQQTEIKKLEEQVKNLKNKTDELLKKNTELERKIVPQKDIQLDGYLKKEDWQKRLSEMEKSFISFNAFQPLVEEILSKPQIPSLIFRNEPEIKSGADTALSNLASVAINTSLVSDTDSTDKLGSTTIAWANLYVDTISSITGNALALTPIAGQSLTVNLSTTGDFVVNTNQLYVDTSSGNVGIGTTEPDQQLSLTKSIGLVATTSDSTGVIYKGSSRFLHNYQPAGAAGQNTFLGVEAGNFTMTAPVGSYEASYNTGIGYQALDALTTGRQNTAVGDKAMTANTTGIYNTAIGQSSLEANISGGTNVAVGVFAIRKNTTGGTNTAVGVSALTSNVTGSSNTAVGEEAGAGVDTNSFSYNSMFGFRACFALATGSNNILLW